MQFNFEKHIPEEEKPELEEEKTQEQFDAEILKEADKLGVSLAELQKDIESYGGVEKCKENFEKNYTDGGGSTYLQMNRAGERVSHMKSEERNRKSEAKGLAVIGGILTAITAVMVSSINQGGNIELENLRHPLEILQQEWNDGFMGKVGVGIVTFFATTGVGGFIGAIKQGIEARRTKRKRKTEELKFKMTGTEVK